MSACKSSLALSFGKTRPREVLWALRDVNFDVAAGEVIGIIGHNGSGKSTLLKILSRVTKPSAGEVDIYGRIGSLLEVGTGFHPDLTGRENVFLNGKILGMNNREIARKFAEIVAFAEVEKFIDEPIKHFSSGMYMRLAFAVAAHLEPEVLLLDEVLAVGDATFQQKCLVKMKEVSREGRTVFFVSHNMHAVQQLCQRALLISEGRLALAGKVEEVIAQYVGVALPAANGDSNLSAEQGSTPLRSSVIQGLALYSAKGTPAAYFYPGDTVIAELSLRLATPVRAPRIALTIEDSVGRRLATVATHFQREPLADIAATCRIRCTLPTLPLGSGIYSLSASLCDQQQRLIDKLRNAASFEIRWNNYYGNGEPHAPVYGPVLLPSVWQRID